MLMDFLCVSSVDSNIPWCLSVLRPVIGGELGGVIVDKFCVDPGGLQLGVIIWERATGDVERARGDTGVCFLRDGTLTPLLKARVVVILSTLLLSFIDSDRRGEEGSFGEGVPLELEKE